MLPSQASQRRLVHAFLPYLPRSHHAPAPARIHAGGGAGRGTRAHCGHRRALRAAQGKCTSGRAFVGGGNPCGDRVGRSQRTACLPACTSPVLIDPPQAFPCPLAARPPGRVRRTPRRLPPGGDERHPGRGCLHSLLQRRCGGVCAGRRRGVGRAGGWERGRACGRCCAARDDALCCTSRCFQRCS